MNKKGQALVEFIIIMPIFIMMMLAAFDFVKIYSTKSDLENVMENVILDNNYEISKDIEFNVRTENDKKIYYLKTEVELTSPIITVFTSNPYKIIIERVVYDK